LLASDIVMFVASALAATSLVQAYWKADVDIGHVRISTAVYVALSILVFGRLGLYSKSFAFRVRDELYYTLAALCIAAAPQFVLFSIMPSISTSRATLLLSLLFSIVLVGAMRAVIHKAYDIASRNGQRVVVIGQPERVDMVVEELRQKQPGLLIYWLAVRDIDRSLQSATLVQPQQFERLDWFRQSLLWRADKLIFTEMPDPDALPHLLIAATSHGITLAVAPPRIRAHAYTVTIETAGSQVLLVPEQLPACRPSARLFKRLFDIVVGALMLVLFGPAMLTIATIMLCDRSGPMLYRQVRVGRNGRPFNILKFRTMRVDAEAGGAQFAVKGDARVTTIGRFIRRTSLDELPQLFNVLHGDMSIVGPRPERPVFVDRFRLQYARYDERHLVKPGLTALSHVQMKRVATAENIGERLNHDLFYVENWSPFLDVSIIATTGFEFLFHRAA
jgi:exopolysaccharide biosynthesis polyprenyl glycosylphosphotransferase